MCLKITLISKFVQIKQVLGQSNRPKSVTLQKLQAQI